jgi:hypothetical protein
MKRLFGYLFGIALLLVGILGGACEISNWSTNFTFFGWAFAGSFLFGGILLLWAVRTHYGGGLWTAIGYVLTANGVTDAFSNLDDFLKKVNPPDAHDTLVCAICLVLGVAFLIQGHRRHSCQAVNDSPLRFGSQSEPPKLLRSAPWAPAWLGVIFGVWFTWHYFSTGYKLYEFAQEWKREGLPLTHDEIDHWYPSVPESQNASVIYLQAITNLVESDLPDIGKIADSLIKPDPAGFNSKRGQVEDVLSHNSKALDLLHAAAARSQSRYPLILDKESRVNFFYLRKLAFCADLLTLESLEQGFNGNSDKVIDSVTAILALANSLAKEPYINSQRCRLYCNAGAVSEIQWILQSFALNDTQLRRLGDALHQSEQIVDLRGAYVTDFCYAMQAEPFRCIDQDLHGHPVYAGACKAIAFITDRKSADKLYYANNVRVCLKALNNPYPLRLQMLPDSKSTRRYALQHGYFLSTYFLAWRRDFNLMAAEDCARLRALQTVVAIERYRIANNDAVPPKLGDLRPRFLAAVPEDPFDGYPLRYQRDGQSFSVYSVGRDMKDDGGKIRQRGQKPEERYDIVVRVEHKTSSKAVTSVQN